MKLTNISIFYYGTQFFKNSGIQNAFVISIVAMMSVRLGNLHELTYEILGIRPLLIDKLSSILIPKDGILLPRKDPAYQL